ncbi:MAG: class I SAM-dependent methyltransferase [Gammaproteobacteria bacterium]|nr:class I SAM-dependent methyltransferase [Gammaproteobacteria bacterium]MDH4315991.1 class I SAM-dependent methyltransferase [Gammaproteobacteria bacterium]MDH5215799.1 class I SAM-dependent methyltransferase [Gammaproteobacteria bacterium]
MKKAKPGWAWRNFWKTDRAASCVPGNADTEIEIHEHWRAYFARLPDNSRILDIATGNGILLLQAAKVARDKHFVLTGIDLADIDPHRYVSEFSQVNVEVDFVAETDAANMPFEDGSFDVVVSQYGLEYAQLGSALDEVERVLRPGGYFCWLAHCEDSDVVMQNRDQSDQVNFLLGPDGPVVAMERLISRIARNKNPKWAMTRLDKSMRLAEAFCRANPPAGIVTEVCNGFTEVANRWQAYAPKNLQKMVVHTRTELVAHRQRITELRAAVIGGKRADLVRERLAAARWEEPEISTLCVGSASGPVGLMIRARRGGC